jgi:lipid II:glycine glycyltransferase (peptidoglycan interpeptide bridge formation enzyme)
MLDVKSNHINQASWQSWTKTAEHPMSMLQDWQYGYAKQITEGWLLDRRVYSFQGKPVAIAQFLVKRLFGIIKIYRINRGPVFLSDNKKLTEAVISTIAGMGNIRKGQILMASFNLERNPSNIALLQRHGFITIELTPYISSYIDLSASEQTLRSKLAGKWRNMLVYAEKRDIVITTAFDRESIEWISTIHEKNMSEKKFQGIQPSLLKAYTGTGNAGVYKAVLDDQVIGAVCVACHGNTCTYLIGWTNEAGRSNKANYLLLWKAILDSKLRGYRFFDSGGIDRFSTEGIANFKLGLNGQPYGLIPTGLKF